MTCRMPGRTMIAVIAFLAIFVSLPLKTIAWGAEMHYSWAYLYALQIGFPHEDAYLIGNMTYNIDFGETSAFPIFGIPDLHFNTKPETTPPDSRDQSIVSHLLSSWESAFTGNDEGFLFNTAAALHSIQDKDAHLDYGPIYHGYHFVMGTIFYGNGKFYSWLDDPYSVDVFTIKSNPTEFSDRAINTLENTKYFMRLQKPFYEILMAEDRMAMTEMLFQTWAAEALNSMELVSEEAETFERMVEAAILELTAIQGSPYQDSYGWTSLLGMDCLQKPQLVQAAGEDFSSQTDVHGFSIAEALIYGSSDSKLEKQLDPFDGLFSMSDEWFEAIGIIDHSQPVDGLQIVREIFTKRLVRIASNLIRQNELLQMRLEKNLGR